MTDFAKISEVLEHEVSRKEFLRYAGLALLGVIGVTSMLNNLQSIGQTSSRQTPRASGYGMSPYGR